MQVFPIMLRNERFPLFVRLGTADWAVLEESWLRGIYDGIRDDISLSSGYAPRIVDLGSNVGLTCRLWRRWWPNARVIAVEPDPDNFSLMLKNIAATGQSEWATTFNACAAACSGVVYLDRNAVECSYHMTSQPDIGWIRVPALSMEEILATQEEAEIDLLKCDIERAEKDLFEDCARWIRLVRNLVVEVHAPYSREQLLTALSRNHGPLLEMPLSNSETQTLIFLRRE